MSEHEPEDMALTAADLTDDEITAILESQQEPDTADPDDPEVN